MDKENRPAFLFYASDWLSSTQDMSAAQRGMYHALLCHQWLRGGLPTDIDRLWRLAGADSKEEFSNAWAMLVHRFSIAINERGHEVFQNLRLERIRIESAEKGDKAKKRAVDAANARWEKERNAASNAQALHNTMLKNANKEDEDRDEDNTSTTEHPYKGGVAITHSKGGAGGIERPSPEFNQALYLRFTAAYGGTGRNPKRTSIEYALLVAMDDCMASIKADAEIRGVNFSAHELQLAAANFLCAQAHACLQQDTAHRNKRMNPETWLSEKCYQSHVGANAPPPTEKETPSQKMKRELEAFKIKHQAEREAQNGSK